MEANIKYKLIKLMGQFKNKTLKDFAFLEKEVGGRKVLLLEMGFLDDSDIRSTMALALDTDITESDSNELYEEIFVK